jgi:hypothetical protein
MHSRKIYYPSNCEFGVQVALISGVSLDGLKTATSGRRGTSGSCYNRRCINDLRNRAAGTEMGQFIHRYELGDNVKLIVPQCPKSPAGTREHKWIGRIGI